MITVKRSRTVRANPDQIFELLADPASLTRLLPRVERVETLERHADHAKLATYMSIGKGFGTIRCEGELRWIAPSQISFSVSKPLPVENRWDLTAVPEGTEIVVVMSLDLTPLLGPLTQFVPTSAVSDMLIKDLDLTLSQVEASFAGDKLQERNAAA